MICKICGVNETDNPDSICDDCNFSIISNDDIPPNI
jgi:NMD protein affecting ribosome stability and mRNA decay